MHSVVWHNGIEPRFTRVAVSLYGDLAARLWSAGPDSGHFLNVWFTEGHRASFDETPVGLFELTGPIEQWQRFYALLTEALDAHETEMRAVVEERGPVAPVAEERGYYVNRSQRVAKLIETCEQLVKDHSLSAYGRQLARQALEDARALIDEEKVQVLDVAPAAEDADEAAAAAERSGW